VTSVDLHLDRQRALSFGSVAKQYDRFRRGLPDAAIDDLLALAPTEVLDVGCGTGKVAAALRAPGVNVLGVESDERMAEVARSHGVRVEVAPFENWTDGGRQFDLITSADAWHWIDPVRGTAKAADVLWPGGTLALFWSYQLFDDDVAEALAAMYRKYAPNCTTHSYEPHQAQTDPIAQVPEFGPIETMTYRWDEQITGAEWTGLLATFSDHLALAPERRLRVLQKVAEVLDEFGGTVTSHWGTYAAFVRRR
jgi:SAM-dependent methyltransferase